MRWWHELKYLIRKLNRRRSEFEVEEEIQSHLESETREKIEAGLSPEEARYAARRAFGSVAIAMEDSRAVWGLRTVEILWQDLRFGARMLMKHLGFTLVAILTLALGIGANTAIFSVVYGVLLKRLPYSDPDRIVTITLSYPLRNIEMLRVADYLEWRKQNRSFAQLAGYDTGEANLSGSGQAERLTLGRVSADFFPLLDVEPILGRNFRPEEDIPGSQRVVLLGRRLWQRRFGSDPEVVGKTLTLDDQVFQIAGVMPSGIGLPGGVGLFEVAAQPDPDAWVPRVPSVPGDFINVIGRLKPGITLAQAKTDMELITRRIQKIPPGKSTGPQVKVSRLSEQLVKNVRLALLILSGAVAFVLIIACVNVANLLLARTITRRRELAVRSALGAGRARLIRQLLTETALLAVTGGLIGMLLAWAGVRWLVALDPDWIPRVRELSINGVVLGFTFLISILTGVMAGLLPALLASKINLNEALKDGLNFFNRRDWWRASPTLVMIEIALSLVLFIGAGLMIRSFLRLMAMDNGFQTVNVLTMKVRLSYSKYPPGQPQRLDYCQNLLARLQRLPGVQSAALTDWLPLTGVTGRSALNIEGHPAWEKGKEPIVETSTVSTDYFRVLGMQMRTGRAFNEDDRTGAPGVVIINETLANRFFSGENPLGKRLDSFNPRSRWVTIVGVVSDVKHLGPDERVRPEIYYPYSQTPVYSDPVFAVRTASEPTRLAAALRREAVAVDPDQPVYEVMTMEQRLSNSLAPRRSGMLLFGAFAAIALILAAIGIYGVISYSVSRRTREIGIRMALGAQRRDVLMLVLKQVLKLTAAGVTIGLIASLALTRLMRNLLFEVNATDPLTFVMVALLLCIVALSASLVPTRRALNVDPLVALKCDC